MIAASYLNTERVGLVNDLMQNMDASMRDKSVVFVYFASLRPPAQGLPVGEISILQAACMEAIREDRYAGRACAEEQHLRLAVRIRWIDELNCTDTH